MSLPERSIPIEPDLTLWQIFKKKAAAISPYHKIETKTLFENLLFKETIAKLLADCRSGFFEIDNEDPRQRSYTVILNNGEAIRYKVEMSFSYLFEVHENVGTANFSARDYEDEWKEAKPDRTTRSVSLTFGYDGIKGFFDPNFNHISIVGISKKDSGKEMNFPLEEKLIFLNELLSAQVDIDSTQIEFDRTKESYDEIESDWSVGWVSEDPKLQIDSDSLHNSSLFAQKSKR